MHGLHVLGNFSLLLKTGSFISEIDKPPQAREDISKHDTKEHLKEKKVNNTKLVYVSCNEDKSRKKLITVNAYINLGSFKTNLR